MGQWIFRCLPILLICSALLTGCKTVPNPALQNSNNASNNPALTQEEAPEYEQPPILEACNLLTPEEYSGENHRVDDYVKNDGMANHYIIHSDFGDFHAAGIEMTRIRINEVNAIARLKEMKRAEAYAKGAYKEVKDFALGPFRWVRKVLRNPLYAVAAIPGDVFKVYGLIDGARKLAQQGFSKEAINDFIGFESAKHNLARHVGVDNGSTNMVLQCELFEVAKAYYAGGAPLHIVDSYIPGIPLPKLTIGDGGGSVGKGIDVIGRELGTKSVKNKLRFMDVPRSDRKALRECPWYSSRARRVITQALFEVKGAQGRNDFMKMALEVDSEDRAYYFRRTAQMIAVLHEQIGLIKQLYIAEEAGIVIAITEDGDVLIPLFADYMVWSSNVATTMEKLPDCLPDDMKLANKHLYVSGEISPRAVMELRELGYTIQTEDEKIDFQETKPNNSKWIFFQ